MNKGIEITLSFIGTVIRAVILVICVVAVINVGKKAYDFGFRVFTEGPVAEAPGRDIVMSVEAGEGKTDIAKKLEEKGITSDWMLFYVQSKLSEFKGSIDPGTYTLNNSMTTDEILAVLTNAEIESDEDEEALPELPNDITEAGSEYSGDGPIEAGSNLVDGDLQEGETAYEGEGGDIEIDNMSSEESESEIDINIGE